MTRRSDGALLKDMLDAARTAQLAAQGREMRSLRSDQVWALGIVKCVEIIGEAASRLSPEFRARHPDVPWADIVGMRNRLVHAYFEIDYEELWSTIHHDLPSLITQLEALQQKDSSAG